MSRAVGTAFLLASASIWPRVTHGYVWPDPTTDQLETLLYEQTGWRASSPAGLVSNCVGVVGTGRSVGAEWVRTAYHDMATADIVAGTGGIDASIGFETERAENPGKAFNGTLQSFTNVATMRSTLSDLIAMAAVFASGACSNGEILIPFRGGRIDAAGPGPTGVPEPQQDIESHTASFKRQGFNASEMIALVACGHSLGGVHGVDFPLVVDVVNDTATDDNTVAFDSTANFFDNKVATEFVANTTQNPLVSGHNETTRSDLRIFSSDGGALMNRFAESPELFSQTCKDLMERMINTVPKEVTLTDVITPVSVKPKWLTVDVNDDGTMSIAGEIRVSHSQVPGQVLIHVSPRSGATCAQDDACTAITATTNPLMTTHCVYANCGPSFQFFDFSGVVPTEQGVSSLTIEIVDSATGASITYDNSGQGFPLPDVIYPQAARSCANINCSSAGCTQERNLTVAILNADQFTEVSLVVYERATLNAMVPGFKQSSIPIVKGQPIAGTNYTLYNVVYNGGLAQVLHPYDIVASGPGGSIESTYNSWGLLSAAACATA
ncbi:heme peroxidase [Thozetella sp. PMI_491]|nr:heme peroxidase [Thozetella sp. PMI_491]